jgi:hypothetical protein
MPELLDALNEADAQAIQSVSDAIETGLQPGTRLDTLARWVRQAPLHSVAIAFLLGVVIARRR